MTPVLVLLAVAVAVVVILFLQQTPAAKQKRRRAAQGRRTASLEREYLRLLQMPLKPAREQLIRVLHEMEHEHPDRSRQWLLEKMVSDLRRDRK